MTDKPNKKRITSDLQDVVFGGKIPPQALDLEDAVLGAMMLEKNAPSRVMSILHEDTFYSDQNKNIFMAISELYYSKLPIDILTVTEQLRKRGKLDVSGGAYHVTQLTNRVASAANLEYHTQILIDKQLKREFITIGSNIAKECFEDESDPYKIKEELETKLLKIHRQLIGSKEKDWDKSVDNAITQIEAAMNNPEHVSGIDTGHKILDAITGGWQNTDLIILAGRPGMGKTSRALSFLKAALKQGKKCKFYSFEMSVTQLIKRMIAEEAGIDLQDLNRGRISDESLQRIRQIAISLKGLPIKVNDDGRMNILDLASECRMLVQSGELDFVIIDYLQITKGPKGNNMNRNDLIGFITGECKNIAKECNIPVMALAQVGRPKEKDKRPDLVDLRESGSIEQDADVVAFIHRPAYYTDGKQKDEHEDWLRDLPEDEYLQYSELLIKKHRNGKTATVKEYFDGSTQRFKAFFRNEEEESPLYISPNYVDPTKPLTTEDEDLPF